MKKNCASSCLFAKTGTDVGDWFLFVPINQSQTSRLYHNDISEEPAAPIFCVEVFLCSEHEGSYVPCNNLGWSPTWCIQFLFIYI